jgi:hypothetical protein
MNPDELMLKTSTKQNGSPGTSLPNMISTFFGMLPYHPFPQLISIIKMGKKPLEGFCLSVATFPDNLCDTHLKSFVPMWD